MTVSAVEQIRERYKMETRPVLPKRRKNFFQRQYQQLRKGDRTVVLKKLNRFIKLLGELPEAVLGLLWAVPAVIVVRLMRPWKRVRFGILRSNRIGHFACEPELYLCARLEGLDDPRTLDIFYFVKQISNRQLAKMWRRVIHVSWWAKWPDWLNRRIPGGGSNMTPKLYNRDVYGLTERFPPQLSFTLAEEEHGSRRLKEMGVKSPDRLVCFHARDNAYLNSVKMQLNPGGDWSYHDHRDSTIQNYVPAAEALADKGYTVVRTGHIVKDPIRTRHPQVVDYAVNGMRDDVMDIYLGAKCRFYICSAVGVCSIPKIFRRPIAFVNFIPLEDIWTWGRQDLLIMKKIWIPAEKRFMTFQEVYKSGAGLMYYSQQYKEAGLEPVENSPEEITALALEMEARLNGVWKANSEFENLQKSFWEMFPKSHLHGPEVLLRIGSEFLYQHRDLLT